MNKPVLLTVLIMLLFTKAHSQTYTSDMQLDESNFQAYNSLLKIQINEKAKTLLITDLENRSAPSKYQIKYDSTINDEDGTIYRYTLTDNMKYNVLQVRRWTVPLSQRGRTYVYEIILSKYKGSQRLFDLGMFCNKVN